MQHSAKARPLLSLCVVALACTVRADDDDDSSSSSSSGSGGYYGNIATYNQLQCTGYHACHKTTVRCTSGKCYLGCSANHACHSLTFIGTGTSRGATVRCSHSKGCYHAVLDFRVSVGTVDVNCDAKQGCKDSTIYCPAGQSCTVNCNGEKACEKVEVVCPSSSLGVYGRINCIGKDACKNMKVSGSCAVYCDSSADCSSSLLRLTGPPVLPVPACVNWRLKAVGFNVACATVCTGLLNIDLCRAACECADTNVPAPAPLPVTLPPAPRALCSVYRVRQDLASVVSSTDCNDICGNTILASVCDIVCECMDTPAPATAAPGSLSVVKRVFRLVLGILLALFDTADFLALLRTLLAALTTDIKVHWTCPASACVNGCPSTGSAKLEAGCKALVAKTTERMASLLQSDNSMGTVLEFSADYTSDGSEAAVNEALVRHIAEQQSGDDETDSFSRYEIQSVDVVDTEVLQTEESGSDDDGLHPGIIALIVIICLLAAAGLVVIILCCCCCKKAKDHHSHNMPDEPKEASV